MGSVRLGRQQVQLVAPDRPGCYSPALIPRLPASSVLEQHQVGSARTLQWRLRRGVCN